MRVVNHSTLINHSLLFPDDGAKLFINICHSELHLRGRALVCKKSMYDSLCAPMHMHLCMLLSLLFLLFAGIYQAMVLVLFRL